MELESLGFLILFEFSIDRQVLSLPPIINGAHSAISLATTDVFIECTATDLNKANVVLNTMVTMFSMYCKEPFTVEPVEVTDAQGATTTCPNLASRTVEVSAESGAGVFTRMCAVSSLPCESGQKPMWRLRSGL